MNIKHSDLIAIANRDLAEKLDRKEQTKKQKPGKDSADSVDQAADSDADMVDRSFKQDIWRAVYTLNIIRYGLGITFLLMAIAPYINSSWNPVSHLIHPNIFFSSTILVIVSAIVFSYFSKYKEVEFNVLVGTQFSFDVVLAAVLTHAAGSIESYFTILFLAVVATGSVVLPRVQALGLASGAIILLFFEHFYSIWSGHLAVTPNYPLMAQYGVLMLGIGLLISYLAEKIRIAELQRFVPGNETIEDFLVREEINALKSALIKTEGNKTEAAKLLGMTFRSFRYKLTKYDID